MQDQLDQLLLARKGLARAAASLGQQAKELPHAKESLSKALAQIKAQQRVLDEQIRALSARPEFSAAARLARVPGIGPVTATAALCAVARKMAKVCWSLARHGTDYDPHRVRQQPQAKDSATPLDKKP